MMPNHTEAFRPTETVAPSTGLSSKLLRQDASATTLGTEPDENLSSETGRRASAYGIGGDSTVSRDSQK